MSQKRIHEEQPLRCMANYYDYGPTSLAYNNTTDHSQSAPNRTIPGRMANYTYTDINCDRDKRGYQKTEEQIHHHARVEAAEATYTTMPSGESQKQTDPLLNVARNGPQDTP
jgi:hypothetical protein